MNVRRFLVSAFAVGLVACAVPSQDTDLEDEEDVGSAESAFVWIDDVTVTVASWTANSVTFRVSNVGGLDCTNLAYTTRANATNGGTGKLQVSSGSIPYLSVGAYKLITVGCPTAGGYTCQSVMLSAPIAGDATPSNNTATKLY